MSKTSNPAQQWNERPNAGHASVGENDSMFRALFERSADAILLLDPRQETFVDCNQAAIEMMGADTKERLIRAHPADLSPELQLDGRPSREKTSEMIAIVLAQGSHRFEWLSRRFDGTDFEVEVMATVVQQGENPLLATVCRNISGRKASEAALRESEARFRSLFERSADAMSVFDPELGRFIESNEAVARQIGAPGQDFLGRATPEEISPLRQPDGRYSAEKASEMIKLALEKGSHRFDWLSRRYDGNELPVEVVLTAIPSGQRTLLFTVSRDISDRKKAEREILELNTSLEQRVFQRTSDLLRANQQLKRAETELRTRAAQMQKHRDVLLDLARSDKSDLAQSLEKICSLAAATMEVARVSYWPLAENGQALICELLYIGESQSVEQQARGICLSASDCPAYFEALAARRPFVADRVLENPATSGMAESYLKPLGITSMLDAPVWLGGKVVGVLCHEHIGPPRDWSAEEIDFASGLATMVSLALEESTRSQSAVRLRESEVKFRALFEASSQGVILHDEEKMLEVNPACIRILGFNDANEMIGKHPAETSAPIQPNGEPAFALAQRHIEDCIAYGNTRFDWLVRNNRGEEIPIEVILTRIVYGGRHLFQAVFNDIAERKRAEKVLRESEARLRESEARFSTAFRASPIMITISTLKDARFIEANDSFVDWLGVGRDQIVGKTSHDLQMWQDEEERAKFLAQLQQHRSVRDIECRLRSQRGSSHTMLLSADIIEVGGEDHMLVFGLDITQRKQAEAELLKTLAREKELGQLRTNFVSMVSHEFRTPLGIIQSSAEILEDYYDQLDLSERADHLLSIRKNTRRMAGLMEEVLLIGSMDAGKMDFKPTRLEPRVLIRRLVEDVLSATDHRCPIELSLGDLPAEMQGDLRLLRHIFTNLLTNAVKYSGRGTPVKFEISCDGADIIATIRDRGIGIPAADLEWLFDAFHRGSNVGDRPGTGLGLVIVKRCVDLHGGGIKIDSTQGEGTTVTVWLPRLKVPVAAGKA